ncbi:MAG: hypothetical protein ACRDWT_14480 [Jatrophihabitantaceae bacterium]
MAGKNKGGREIRKPKQAKKPKATESTSPLTPPAKVKRPASR